MKYRTLLVMWESIPWLVGLVDWSIKFTHIKTNQAFIINQNT